MIILKIIFLALLCLPLFYVAMIFFGKLIEEIRNKNNEAAEETSRRMRNAINSDRSKYNQYYYQGRMQTEVARRSTRNAKRQRKPGSRER